MDSINKNQPEDNHENLYSGKAVEKIKELTGKADSCFFTTAVSVAGSCGTRPMSVEEVDDTWEWYCLSRFHRLIEGGECR